MKSQRAFGEALRRHREQCGVSIESIALQTKISASLLRGLEKGDCARWPTGIYSRSYVRDYAVAVGLDPDDLAAQFSEVFLATAFPERAEQLGSKSQHPPRPDPLRLTFATDPAARTRLVWRRTALVLLDCLLMLVLATALRMTIVPSFWMALAGVALGCHVLALAAGGLGAAGLFARVFRAQPEPDPEASQEPALAESA